MCDDDFEDECRWFPYRVVARVDAHGERREQVWLGRDANHALERAHQHNPSLFTPLPDSAIATRIWDASDPSDDDPRTEAQESSAQCTTMSLGSPARRCVLEPGHGGSHRFYKRVARNAS